MNRLVSPDGTPVVGRAERVRPEAPPPANPVKGAPVSGVQFTAYEINEIDLKTSEGWTKVNALTNTGAIPDNACANPAQPTLPNYTFGQGRVSPDTDGSGEGQDREPAGQGLSRVRDQDSWRHRPEGQALSL